MFIIGLLLGAAVMVFVIQNITVVTVSFLVWQFDASLALVLLLCVIAGMLIGTLLSLPELWRRGSERSRLLRHNRELAESLDAHKVQLAKTQAKLESAQTPVVIEQTTVTEND